MVFKFQKALYYLVELEKQHIHTIPFQILTFHAYPATQSRPKEIVTRLGIRFDKEPIGSKDRIGQGLSKFINSIYSFILAGGKSGHFLEEKAEILHRRESEFSYDLAKRFL